MSQISNIFIGYVKTLGMARGIILAFVGILFLLAVLKDLELAELINDTLSRTGRNGLLVLSLMPFIKGGLGLNFGLPVGILCGLVGLVITMEFNIVGLTGFTMACVLGGGIAVVIGYLYGHLLNKVKGQEMVVGTYVGFASVSVMCLFWLMAPFHNPKMIWALGGTGLRVTVPLDDYYVRILDSFLAFRIGGVLIPTGLLLFFLAACVFVALFFRTRTGINIKAAGENERFAIASSIKPQRTRIQATIFSTVVAAIGIVVYCQSFGFVQLYTAPLLMAFPIIACILIGGAGVKDASIAHVIIGAFVLQAILSFALPVTEQFIKADFSETARIIISNGIIVYALAGLGANK